MKDGGSAFPSQIQEGQIDPGMSLRDYFAAAALQGLLSGCEARHIGEMPNCDAYASNAYEMADAMLRERKVNDE